MIDVDYEAALQWALNNGHWCWAVRDAADIPDLIENGDSAHPRVAMVVLIRNRSDTTSYRIVRQPSTTTTGPRG